jgi:hypothetical protein
MLPDSIIKVPNFDEWTSQIEACRIIDINQSNWPDIVRRYKPTSARIAGRIVYYKPDVEAISVKVAAMRSKREAKRVAA